MACSWIPELAHLFSRSGFELTVALFPESEGWVSPLAFQRIIGKPPIFLGRSQEGQPNVRHLRFAAVIAAGVSPGALSMIPEGKTALPADLLSPDRNPVFLLAEDSPHFPAPRVPGEGLSGINHLAIPATPAGMHGFFLNLFSRVIRLLTRRNDLRKVPVRVSRTIPPGLESLAGASPEWVRSLEAELSGAGFALVDEVPKGDAVSTVGDAALGDAAGEACGVGIETFEGPFLLAKKRTGKLEMSFDPGGASPLQACSLMVRFFSRDVDPEELAALSGPSLIPVTRDEAGNLTVFVEGVPRIFPDCEEQPALRRFVEFVADCVLHRISRTVAE